MIDYDAVKAVLEKAHTELSEICGQGVRDRWRMHIPAQPDYDSDLIISDALRHADALLAEVEQLREQINGEGSAREYAEARLDDMESVEEENRELRADRDQAREIAVALEQENARLTEENARLLSAASAAYGLPVDEVLAAVREEMASERGEVA